MKLFKLILTLTALLTVSGCIAVPVGPAYANGAYPPAPGSYYGPAPYYGPSVNFGIYGGGGGYRGGYRR